MSAVERVRLRLRSALLDLEAAISFYEAARIPHLRTDIQARFSDTEAGHTFRAVRTAALFQTALTVMRLWDQHDDTASLVAIARDLRSDELLDALAADAARQLGALFGSSIRKEKRDDLIELRDGVLKIKESSLRARFERLRAYRDKRLAHRDPFETPRGVLAQTTEVKDIAIVLAASCHFMRRARLAIDFTYDSPRQHRMIRRRYAEAFWNIPLRAPRHDDD